ncbi:hypothetical protein KIPB_005901, partial [Kipferlia bialata]
LLLEAVDSTSTAEVDLWIARVHVERTFTQCVLLRTDIGCIPPIPMYQASPASVLGQKAACDSQTVTAQDVMRHCERALDSVSLCGGFVLEHIDALTTMCEGAIIGGRGKTAWAFWEMAEKALFALFVVGTLPIFALSGGHESMHRCQGILERLVRALLCMGKAQIRAHLHVFDALLTSQHILANMRLQAEWPLPGVGARGLLSRADREAQPNSASAFAGLLSPSLLRWLVLGMPPAGSRGLAVLPPEGMCLDLYPEVPDLSHHRGDSVAMDISSIGDTERERDEREGETSNKTDVSHYSQTSLLRQGGGSPRVQGGKPLLSLYRDGAHFLSDPAMRAQMRLDRGGERERERERAHSRASDRSHSQSGPDHRRSMSLSVSYDHGGQGIDSSGNYTGAHDLIGVSRSPSSEVGPGTGGYTRSGSGFDTDLDTDRDMSTLGGLGVAGHDIGRVESLVHEAKGHCVRLRHIRARLANSRTSPARSRRGAAQATQALLRCMSELRTIMMPALYGDAGEDVYEGLECLISSDERERERERMNDTGEQRVGDTGEAAKDSDEPELTSDMDDLSPNPSLYTHAQPTGTGAALTGGMAGVDMLDDSPLLNTDTLIRLSDPAAEAHISPPCVAVVHACGCVFALNTNSGERGAVVLGEALGGSVRTSQTMERVVTKTSARGSARGKQGRERGREPQLERLRDRERERDDVSSDREREREREVSRSTQDGENSPRVMVKGSPQTAIVTQAGKVESTVSPRAPSQTEGEGEGETERHVDDFDLDSESSASSLSRRTSVTAFRQQAADADVGPSPDHTHTDTTHSHDTNSMDTLGNTSTSEAPALPLPSDGVLRVWAPSSVGTLGGDRDGSTEYLSFLLSSSRSTVSPISLDDAAAFIKSLSHRLGPLAPVFGVQHFTSSQGLPSPEGLETASDLASTALLEWMGLLQRHERERSRRIVSEGAAPDSVARTLAGLVPGVELVASPVASVLPWSLLLSSVPEMRTTIASVSVARRRQRDALSLRGALRNCLTTLLTMKCPPGTKAKHLRRRQDQITRGLKDSAVQPRQFLPRYYAFCLPNEAKGRVSNPVETIRRRNLVSLTSACLGTAEPYEQSDLLT